MDAVLDYGQAIKDLAAANIFTGDMLLKNFGVTRHGRVIFYDYDELCLLTECNFREMPAGPRRGRRDGARSRGSTSGERDVFPEEFRAFLTLPGTPGRGRSCGPMATCSTWSFWRRMQELRGCGRGGGLLSL